MIRRIFITLKAYVRWSPEVEAGVWGMWVKATKGYKLPAVSKVSVTRV